MLHIINKAFIAPIREQKLLPLYAALAAGILGFTFIELFVVLSLVNLGMQTLIVYFALRFIIANLLFHPIITLTHNAFGFRKTVMAYVCLQACLMIALSIENSSLHNTYFAAIFFAVAVTV